jgi:hypothetical protein
MSKQSRIRQKQKAEINPRRRLPKKPFLIFGALALVALVASIYAFVWASKNSSKEKWSKIESSKFQFYTNAEEGLDKMVQAKDADIDLALANWLIVADIPEFQNLTREDYFKQLDAMTEQVKQKMAKWQAAGWPTANSDDPQTRCQRFCSAMIRLNFGYAKEFQDATNLTPMVMKALYSNPDNIFLAGLLRTKQGTCVSMPLIYLVIGQRFNMPVHLVEIGKHYFIRWDEPRFHMDIETTITTETAWTTDESVYLDSEGMTRDQLRGSDLRNLTNHEVVGELLFARTSYWHIKGGDFESRSRNDLVRAHNLAPDDPGINGLYQSVFSFHGIQPVKSTAIKPKI